FLDFLIDGFKGEQVAFLGSERTIERAERAVLGAEIRVVDVAVDLIGRHARICFFAAHFHGGHPDANQVIGAKQIEGFLLCQSHRGSVLMKCRLESRHLRPHLATFCRAASGVLANSTSRDSGIKPARAHSSKYRFKPARFSSSSEKSIFSVR